MEKDKNVDFETTVTQAAGVPNVDLMHQKVDQDCFG